MQNQDVRRHVQDLETKLDAVDRLPGGAREDALAALQALLCLYGEAIARIMRLLEGSAAGQEVRTALVGDELLRNLLLIHGAHPQDAASRVRHALDEVRPALAPGAAVRLLGMEDGVVRVRLESPSTDHCCVTSKEAMSASVEQAIRRAAPEIAGIEVESGPIQTAPRSGFVPLDSFLSRPPAPPEERR